MASKQDLAEQARKLDPNNPFRFLDDLEAYYLNGGRRHVTSIVDEIHPLVRKELGRDEQDRLADLELGRYKAPTLGADLVEEQFRKDLEFVNRWAEDHISPHFKKVVGKGGTSYVQVVDYNKQLVKEWIEKEIDTRIDSRIARELAKENIYLRSTTITEIRKQWKMNVKPIPTPASMLMPDVEGWCFHRPTVFPDAKTSFPAWEKILDRMSDRDAFAAWWWGVYSGEYLGRQCIWLHGSEGEDGKSLIIKLLADVLFGNAYAAITNAMVNTQEKRFLTSFFVNKRLVIYPDANNRKALLSEQFKTVASAGADPVPIEPKGQQAYTATLEARMIIASNHAPTVVKERYLLSRLLYVAIAPLKEEPDPTIRDILTKELPGFLFYAKTCWNELNHNRYKIEQTDASLRHMQDLLESEYEEFEEIFARNWEYSPNPDDIVDGQDVKRVLEQAGVKQGGEQKKFHDWLEREKQIIKTDTYPRRFMHMRFRRKRVARTDDGFNEDL